TTHHQRTPARGQAHRGYRRFAVGHLQHDPGTPDRWWPAGPECWWPGDDHPGRTRDPAQCGSQQPALELCAVTAAVATRHHIELTDRLGSCRDERRLPFLLLAPLASSVLFGRGWACLGMTRYH